MAIVFCENGHQYDTTRFSICPYCGVDLKKKGKKVKRSFFSKEDDITQKRESESDDKTERRTYPDFQKDDQKTVGVYHVKFEGEPVVGWLVCIRGPERGRDYRIIPARNRIGRSPINQIVLPDDPEIKLDAHAEIIYDPKSNEFSIVDSEGIISLHGKNVYGAAPLNDGDHIEIGSSEFIFVAFCKGDRRW